MKKLFLLALVMVMTLPSFAQSTSAKANFKKAQSLYATALVGKDLDEKNKLLTEAMTLLKSCMDDPQTASNYQVWRQAADVSASLNQIVYTRYTNTKVLDTIPYLENYANMVRYSSKAYDLLQTPNEKGKKPLKDADIEAERTNYLQLALLARQQLGANSRILHTVNPAKCVELQDLYLDSFKMPLFAGKSTAEDDTIKNELNYIYAVAYKNLGNTAKYHEYLEKSFDSPNGAAACYEIMMDARNAGDMDKYLKYCKIGVEKFPEEKAFESYLTEYYFKNKKWTEFNEFADGLLAKDPNNANVLRMKAQSAFEQNKHKETLELLDKVKALEPNDPDITEFIGNLNFTMGQRNSANKKVADAYYKKAIAAYEELHAKYPNEPKRWGYALRVCYNNIGDLANSKKFAKYTE